MTMQPCASALRPSLAAGNIAACNIAQPYVATFYRWHDRSRSLGDFLAAIQIDKTTKFTDVVLHRMRVEVCSKTTLPPQGH